MRPTKLWYRYISKLSELGVGVDENGLMSDGIISYRFRGIYGTVPVTVEYTNDILGCPGYVVVVMDNREIMCLTVSNYQSPIDVHMYSLFR